MHIYLFYSIKKISHLLSNRVYIKCYHHTESHGTGSEALLHRCHNIGRRSYIAATAIWKVTAQQRKLYHMLD